MKKFIDIDKDLGDAKLSSAFGVEDSHLKIRAEVSYPVEKIIEPATKAVDNLLDKLEKLIPGDWDKPLIERLKVEYKEELTKLIEG